MGDWPDIDATELSSDPRAIYDQDHRAPGHTRGALALRLRNAELVSYSRVKDLYRLPE